jgi:hypothetical protein
MPVPASLSFLTLLLSKLQALSYTVTQAKPVRVGVKSSWFCAFMAAVFCELFYWLLCNFSKWGGFFAAFSPAGGSGSQLPGGISGQWRYQASAQPLTGHLTTPQPVTFKKLQAILVVVNCCFLPGAAGLLRPLTDALRGGHSGNQPVPWSPALIHTGQVSDESVECLYCTEPKATCRQCKYQPNAYNMYTDLEGILSACLYLHISFYSGVVHFCRYAFSIGG